MNTLNGFDRPQGGRRGGVRRLWLARASDIVSVSCGAGGECGAVTPVTAFAEYAFREGSAFYNEGLVVQGGAAKIVHELVFELPLSGTGSYSALDGITEASCGGIVALLLTEVGDVLLAGWSSLFGTGRPLRLETCASTTGSIPDDTPVRKVTLRSEDASPAGVYTGAMP